MIRLAKTDIRQVALSTLGALALCAGVAPAEAAAPTDAADWQERTQRAVTGLQFEHVAPGAAGQMLVDARYGADGRFDHAATARSSGDAQVDAEVLRAVARAALPRMPEELRGAPRTVHLRLFYGDTARQVADAMARDMRYASQTTPGRRIAR